MVIECIVICVDNSEFMRNEDFLPNRMKAQVEAVQVIIYSKIRASPENYLSIVTMGNNRVNTHLTNQEAKLLSNLSQITMEGSSQLLQSFNLSQLVLKHRPIKHAKCRIIAFVGSPVVGNERDFVDLGKRFKKENVLVDIVTFGSEPGVGVLRTIINTLNGANGGNNTFHTIPPYLVLADYVVSSGLAQSRVAGTFSDDADEDEELRRAIEWSMQESGSAMPPNTAQPTGIQDGNDLSDDEQLQIALQLSLQEAERLEAIEETQGARSSTPESRQREVPANTPTAGSASPENSTNGNAPSNGAPPNSANSSEDPKNQSRSPQSPNSNNSNPNNNAAPTNAVDGGKIATDKDSKKTVLTKKDKNRN